MYGRDRYLFSIVTFPFARYREPVTLRSPSPVPFRRYQSSGAQSSAYTVLNQTNVNEEIHHQLRLRNALDCLAQDLLDLSQYLAQTTAKRQQLISQRVELFKHYSATENQEKKSQLLAEFDSITNSIRSLDKEIIHARERKIPVSGFSILVKRLHGQLPDSQIAHNCNSNSQNRSKQLRLSHQVLNKLFSLPSPRLLEELAKHILTTSLPFTLDSFLLIIRKLSAHRLASAARSAYHALISAGHPPDSVKAISTILTIASATSDYEEFYRLQALIEEHQISHDSYTYSALIVGNLKLGARFAALRHFRAMIQQGVTASLQVLTALLRDCGARRDWTLGKEVWRGLRLGQSNADFRIDAWAYRQMWILCKRCGQWQAAQQVLNSAIRDGFVLADLLSHRRKTFKSLPIRSQNKSPVIGDVYNSIFASMLNIVNSIESLPYSASFDTLPSSLGIVTTRAGRKIAMRRARRYLDLLIHRRSRTCLYARNGFDISRTEIAEPLEISPCGLAATSVVTDSQEENLSDILEEEGDLYSITLHLADKILMSDSNTSTALPARTNDMPLSPEPRRAEPEEFPPRRIKKVLRIRKFVSRKARGRKTSSL